MCSVLDPATAGQAASEKSCDVKLKTICHLIGAQHRGQETPCQMVSGRPGLAIG